MGLKRSVGNIPCIFMLAALLLQRRHLTCFYIVIPLQRQTLVPAFWTGSQGLIPCANTSNAFFWKTSSCAHWVFYNCQVVLLTATLIKRVWLRWWMARPAGAAPNWRSSLLNKESDVFLKSRWFQSSMQRCHPQTNLKDPFHKRNDWLNELKQLQRKF